MSVKKILSGALAFLLYAALFFILFALIEGGASLLYFLRTTLHQPSFAESKHVEYDPEIGWINARGLRLENFYGPGKSLTLSEQRFRGTGFLPAKCPPGETRLFCSGDSFTFGYGVNDSDSWPARLEALASGRRVINWANGGYGVDQAYLWYLKAAHPLRHHLHLFAFNLADFDRMKHHQFISGYGKPLLSIRDHQLVISKTPVPMRPFYAPWLNLLHKSIRELKCVQIAREILSEESSSPPPETLLLPKQLEVIRYIFNDLQAKADAANIHLVLIYLPLQTDHTGAGSDPYRSFIRENATANHWKFWDGISALRKLPPEEIPSLYIQRDVEGYAFSAGHYTEKGNEWVAQQIDRFLQP